MIDPAKKNALIEHIKRLEQSNDREILLPPDLFFDGYDDDHCIICANAGHFSTSKFRNLLREIRQNPGVLGVFIRFYEYADALESQDAWVGSDSVYIITNASVESIASWFSAIPPSDVWVESETAEFPSIPLITEGFRLVAVWWD
jgi:hypothetical protein